MGENITTTGIIATDPRHVTTADGLAITSFRLAANQRRFNRDTREWETTETNWFTVSAFRRLAGNLAASVHKGDHVVVTGRLRVRSWENGSRSGVTVEVEADAVGHDLSWGTTRFARAPLAPVEEPTTAEPAETLAVSAPVAQ